MSEYNGWSNWETWNLNSCITNDKYVYESAREIAASFPESDFKEWCEDFVVSSLGLGKEEVVSGPGIDFIYASLREVNYAELIKSLGE